MLELEILGRRPAHARANGTRVLLVHGICVGAWVWEEHFMPYLADAGFDVHALSLRGHGKSEGREGLDGWRLADYADDLRRTVATLGGSSDSRPLVVVGHSLGGAVVQDWVRSGGHATGVALLASVPPWGLAYSAWQMWLSSPALFQQMARMSFAEAAMLDPQVMRAHLFSNDLADFEYARFARRVQGESRQVGLELQGWRRFAPMPWQAPPTFVLGGLDDRFIRPDAVRGTAGYYGVAPVLVPRLAHALMLDPRWEEAARLLLDWLVGLAGRAG